MTIVWEEKRQNLRREADALLASLSPNEEQAKPNDVLLHELLVHKVELEMQNEELRNAHMALEVARDRYIDLYEFAPIAYITINRDGMISDINLTGCGLLGMNRSQLINYRFSKLLGPQDADNWHIRFMRIMKEESSLPHAFELQMQRADGTTFYAHVDCQCRREDSTVPSLLRMSLVDISKLKQSEMESRLAAIAFESADGMMITDADNVILRVNRSLLDSTGYQAEELVGKNPRLLQSDRHPAEFFTAMWDGLHRTGSWYGDIWIRKKNGEHLSQHLTLAAVKDEQGHVTHYVATYRNTGIEGHSPQ